MDQRELIQKVESLHRKEARLIWRLSSTRYFNIIANQIRRSEGFFASPSYVRYAAAECVRLKKIGVEYRYKSLIRNVIKEFIYKNKNSDQIILSEVYYILAMQREFIPSMDNEVVIDGIKVGVRGE